MRKGTAMAALTALVMLLAAGPLHAADIRLGVYNLQQVYENYPGTQGLEQDMQAIQREAQAAQQQQDQQRLQQLQREAQELQQEVMQRFQDDVEEVSMTLSDEHNVDAIVVEVVHYGDNVELVDLTREVTDALSER